MNAVLDRADPIRSVDRSFRPEPFHSSHRSFLPQAYRFVFEPRRTEEEMEMEMEMELARRNREGGSIDLIKY